MRNVVVSTFFIELTMRLTHSAEQKSDFPEQMYMLCYIVKFNYQYLSCGSRGITLNFSMHTTRNLIQLKMRRLRKTTGCVTASIDFFAPVALEEVRKKN